VWRKDRRRRFKIVPYQEAPSPPMTPELHAACEHAVHVVRHNGEVLRAGRAALHVLHYLGWPRTMTLLSLPPFVWLVEMAYAAVAEHRPFFARFLFTRDV
jgi:predicted DCC family thiol-disulfide oxidoreductase YuxK